MEAVETLNTLSKSYDIDSLTEQLKDVLASKDPVGYMQQNINWEIDQDFDNNEKLKDLSQMMSFDFAVSRNYELWNPFRRFLNWLSRNRFAGQVKKAICTVTNEIQKLLDEEAELKKILGVVLAALATSIGIGAINPVLLTLVVGLLATAILKGVANFCGI